MTSRPTAENKHNSYGMTVTEAQRNKRIVEDSIRELLNALSHDTGCTITDISLVDLSTYSANYYGVSIELTL